MTNLSRPFPASTLVGMAAAWMTLPACSTQQVGANEIVVDQNPTAAAAGLLVIVCAPAPATYEEQQADLSTVEYDVFIDGKRASGPATRGRRPLSPTGVGMAYRPVGAGTTSPGPLQTLFEDDWAHTTMHFSASPRYIADDGTILSPGD